MVESDLGHEMDPVFSIWQWTDHLPDLHEDTSVTNCA